MLNSKTQIVAGLEHFGREAKLEQFRLSVEDLLREIDLNTDCMDGRIKREALDKWTDKVEAAIKEIPRFEPVITAETETA